MTGILAVKYTRAEWQALRKLESAERHLAMAYTLLTEAHALSPDTVPLGGNLGNEAEHLNEQVRREIRYAMERAR